MSKNNQFPRGAEWRQWDLHIHTPSSHTSEYAGATEDEKWNNFFEQLEIISEKIKVIGINDYLFIDGYKKVLEHKKKGNLKKIELILPVIEFRLKEFVGCSDLQRINYHVIFADNSIITPEQIEAQFLSKLNASCNLDPNNTDAITWGGVVTRESLIDLGKNIQTHTPLEKRNNDSYLKTGFNNINYDLFRIEKALGERGDPNTYLKDNYFKAIGKVEWGKFRWESCPAEKKTIINNSHFIFSASPTPKDALKVKQSLLEQGVNSRLLHCSDAHQIAENPNSTKPKELGHCFTWIKADPTFEGLKQILYEADDRTKIQESKPEERESYQIIDSVQFLDKNFTQEEISLNQNLTVIIGGKSTGKSVLLRNMAIAIDKKEVDTRINEAKLQPYPIELEVHNFSVKWCDGQESKKVNSQTNKKIIYIPQSYLNRLVDKKETKTPIFKIVEDALRQDDSVKESFDKLDAQQREIERNISAAVNSLFFIEKDIQDLSAAIKNLGDKHGVEIEIKKLEAEIATLKESSGISAEELQKYDKLKNSYTKLNDQKTANKKDLENLNILKEKEIFISPNLSSLSEDVKKSLAKEYESITEKYLYQWKKKIDDAINTIKVTDIELDKSIESLTEEEKPLSEKVKSSESLNNKINSLKEEQRKLKIITEEEKKLIAEKEKFSAIITQIAENNSKFYDNLLSARNEILKQNNISGEEFEFDISVEFKSEIFQKTFVEEVCDRRSIGSFDSKLDNYKFIDNANLKDDIKKTVDGILKGTLVLKTNYTKQEAIKKLVQNWFLFHYQIKDGADDISTMSPGKKSFIILKLLIELSNDRCPILLDQPEDDLDNRSIYNDLVKFIKDKKKSRQIIIVTHNPNLVVGADAECVIVANQSGAKSKNKEYKFEYVTGSLENGFVDKNEDKILYKQGIREHVCDILEGGEDAFKKRQNKYDIGKNMLGK